MSYYSYDNRGGGGFLANVPTAVKNIIIINALVMVMTALNKTFMYETFALFYPTSQFFHWWQPVTHMFMHGGFWHLFFNMYTLFIFGSVLENVWGTKKFLTFYFVTGIGAALVNIGVQYLTGSFALTVGASGAIYGVLIYSMGFTSLIQNRKFSMFYAIAAMLFIFSDSCIAYNRFVEHIPNATMWIMTTYYAAQGIFCMLHLTREEK